MKKIFLLFCLVSVISTVHAKLNVIADFGGESAVRFYEGIQPVHTENAPKHPNAIPGTLTEEQLLPVVSHKWSIGTVQNQKYNLPGAMPIFLIGYDKTSISWVRENTQKLIALNATGLVINANNIEELNTLKNLIPELSFIPVSADSLGERMGIYHYPLLITSEGISQ